MRDLQLASALRAIVSEHLDELEQDEQLTRAERWQRDQAWASAQSIADGTARPASWQDLRDEFARAVEGLRKRRTAG